MKKSQLSNLITTVYQPEDRDRATKRLVLRCLINSLTSASCNALMSHFYEAENPNRMSTLDARNEEDAKFRANEMNAEHKEEIGYEVNMAPYRVAQITNALRYRLYADCLRTPNEDGKMDYLEPRGLHDPLICEMPPKMPVRGEFTNYDQPMSAEWLLKYRITQSLKPNDTEIHNFALMQQAFLGAPVDVDEAEIQLEQLKTDAYVLERENGLKDQAKLKAMMPRVLDELKGMWGGKEVGDDEVTKDGQLVLGDHSTFDIFKSLPRATQLKIGKGVVQKLGNAYANTYKRARNNPALLSDCMLIMTVNRRAKLWLDDIEAVMEEERDHEIVGVDQVNGVADLMPAVKALQAKLEPVKEAKTKTKGPKALATS